MEETQEPPPGRETTNPDPVVPVWNEVGESEHLAQLYQTDDFLVDTVVRFFAAALLAGEGVLVIATADHRERIEKELTRRGANLSAAGCVGQFVELDAGETIAAFMDGDLPDPIRFAEVVGGPLATLARGRARVRVFAETVALLWREGRREAAFRVEEEWNDLARRHSFTLLCACPIADFGGEIDSDAFARICSCHSRVLPAESDSELATRDEGFSAISGLQQQSVALRSQVTQRERAERELTDFFENALEGVHSVGPDGRILWANQAELDLLGYRSEEYVGRHVADFHVDREVIGEILSTLAAGRDVVNRLVRLRHKSGAVKHLLVHSNGCYEEGRLLYTRCFTRDMTEHVEAERDRALLAAIVESSDDAIISKDLDGVITSWNRGAEQLFGYTAEEAVGRPVTMLMPEERVGEEPGILDRVRRGVRVDPYETVRRRKDGTLVDVSLAVSPVRDADGRIIGASKVARDITDRKRIEEKLSRSEERYRRLAELLPVGVYACEAPSGRITYYNEEAVRLWGRAPDVDQTDERFSSSLKLLLPDGETALPHDLRPMTVALREGREFRNEETVIERRDGTRITALVNIDPIRGEDGRIQGAINVFHDVSASKRTEQALREQKDNLQTLLDTLPVAVLIAQDRECRRISGNRVAEELLRMQPDGNVSKSAQPDAESAHYRVLRNGETIAPEELPMQRAARGESVQGEEVDHVFDDGAVVRTLVWAQPLHDAAGEPRGAIACVLDITDLKRSEDALRYADRRKDEFLATLAHELRNPLAALGNALALLGTARGDLDTVEDAREVMERQLAQLTRLVEDLLDVSRISRGTLELRRSRVDLVPILSQAVRDCLPPESADRDLEVSIRSSSIPLDADPVRLAQVFGNLLNNAFRFTAPGGRIRVSAGREGDHAVVEVEDDGVGIPAEKLSVIFEMFAQVPDSQGRSQGGLGIGLTLVKQLVAMHGGSVEAWSDGSSGSRFVVRVPIAEKRPEPRTAVVDRTSETAPVRSLRVLVVDDNRDAGRILARLLATDGHAVQVAFDGEEAVRAAETSPPDVALLDIGLPGIDGCETARRIRRLPDCAQTTLIAVSGWGQAEDKRRSREAGFRMHLVKPVDPMALMRLLVELRDEGEPG